SECQTHRVRNIRKDISCCFRLFYNLFLCLNHRNKPNFCYRLISKTNEHTSFFLLLKTKAYLLQLVLRASIGKIRLRFLLFRETLCRFLLFGKYPKRKKLYHRIEKEFHLCTTSNP